jgi:flagellar basal-body rod protein FlgB
MILESKTLKALAASLKFREMRQEIISANVANAETPGYKTKRVDFEAALARALDVDGKMQMNTTDERHFDVGNGGFGNLKPEIYEDPNGVVSDDGNTVDRDAELARMAENKILYDAAVQLINKKTALMKYAVGSN